MSQLAGELRRQRHQVGPTTVVRLLRVAGYSLQGNRKTGEAASNPDRDAQFRFINQRVGATIAQYSSGIAREVAAACFGHPWTAETFSDEVIKEPAEGRFMWQSAVLSGCCIRCTLLGLSCAWPRGEEADADSDGIPALSSELDVLLLEGLPRRS